MDKLLSAKSDVSKVEFGEFAKERTRIFGQRMPRRDPVDKDGGGESGPEKTEHLHGCKDSATRMRKIEECQACWDSQEQNEQPERSTSLCLLEYEMYKLVEEKVTRMHWLHYGG